MINTLRSIQIVLSIFGIFAMFLLSAAKVQSAPYFFKSPVQLDKIKGEGATIKSARARTNPPGGGGETDWQLTAIGTLENATDLIHTSWELERSPFGAWDRIRLYRLASNKPAPRKPISKNKVIFLLPGTFDAGGWSRVDREDANLYIFLARNGYDVYTVSFRNAFIPNMRYEQLQESGIDLAVTSTWTFGMYREDVKACVDQIKRVSHTRKIFLGGFSRGVLLSFIYASKYQNDLKGIVALDGPVKKYPPNAGEAVNESTYAYLIDLFQQGWLPVSDTCDSVLCPPPGYYPLLGEATWENYAGWQLASVVPHATVNAGDALPPSFNTISDFVADDAYYIWGDGVLTNYYNGMIDKNILIAGLAEFTRYWPIVQDFEWWQLDAHDDVPYFDYDDNPVDLPTIAFLSGLFCPNGDCLDTNLPNRTINPDTTINYLDTYGHLDIMMGKLSLEDVKMPLLHWLNNHR